MDDQRLIDAFVASFTKLDDVIAYAGLIVPPELQADWVEGFERWRPIAVRTDPAALAAVFERVPGRFPPLYERLILSRAQQGTIGHCGR